MRTALILLFLMVLAPAKSWACDICGCGVGSYYIGILPDFKKRFVGLRYQNKLLVSHLNENGERTYLTTNERFHTIEVWGALNIGKRFRAMYILPYNFISKNNQGTTSSKSGFGDAAIFGYYNVLRKEHTTDHLKRIIQSLWLGAGVKVPTGGYNPADKSESAQQLNTFQLGTGSTDFSFNMMYDLRIHDAGMNVNTNYKINTANNTGYRYGNKLTTMLLGYYKWRLGQQGSFSPNAGFVLESATKDVSGSLVQHGTGGAIWMASVGVECSVRKISVGINFQDPLHQNLGNGIVLARERLMVHCSTGF